MLSQIYLWCFFLCGGAADPEVSKSKRHQSISLLESRGSQFNRSKLAPEFERHVNDFLTSSNEDCLELGKIEAKSGIMDL